MTNNLKLSSKVKLGINAVLQYAEKVKIKSTEHMVEASENVKRISELKNEIENQRTQFTKPLNESLRNINTFFKKFSQPLEEADKILRGKLIEHKKNLEESQNIFGAIHFVSSTSIEVIDIKKVPYEYLMVDEKKVQAAIKSGVEKIKGLEFVNNKKVSL